MTQLKYRTLALVVVLLFALAALAGCGGGDKPAAKEAPKAPAAAEKPAEKAADKATDKKAAKFPEKPITLIIPYATGGGSDLITRALAQAANKNLPQPLNIVNKPGAASALGYKDLYNSKPDGYTLCSTTSTMVTHKLVGNLPYNHKDYEMVMIYNYESACLVVPKDKTWKDLKEFVDFVKKNPGKAKVATSSKGGIWNMATTYFAKQAGLDFQIVPDGGGAANSVTMAAGGHVDAAMCSPLEAFTQIKAGNLKLLAVMAPERNSVFPDVPLFKEQGYDMSVLTTRAVIAPKGTPKDIIDVLHVAFKKAADDPQYLQFLKDNGAMPLNLNPAETVKYYDDQEKQYREILRITGELNEGGASK